MIWGKSEDCISRIMACCHFLIYKSSDAWTWTWIELWPLISHRPFSDSALNTGLSGPSSKADDKSAIVVLMGYYICFEQLFEPQVLFPLINYSHSISKKHFRHYRVSAINSNRSTTRPRAFTDDKSEPVSSVLVNDHDDATVHADKTITSSDPSA